MHLRCNLDIMLRVLVYTQIFTIPVLGFLDVLHNAKVKHGLNITFTTKAKISMVSN